MSKPKSYKLLCDELEAILDEMYDWKHGLSNNKKMGLLGKDYTYFDELSYIRRRIEKEMIPHEIVFRTDLYKKLANKIPKDVVLHIASFGDVVDKAAAKFITSMF